MSGKDDNELVYEVIHGSISSFEVLIDRYQNKIFNIMLRMVANRETAKDLTQDVFLKVFENLENFNFKYRFFSWIYRIAVNEAINYSRSRPRTVNLAEAAHLTEEMHSSRNQNESGMLNQAIRNLVHEYRVLILLKYYCNLSYDEIAEVTNLSVKKVRSRLFMAREQIRNDLLAKGFFSND